MGFERCFRVSCIGLFDTLVNDLIFAVLVIIVLVGLPDVVRWVADNHCDRRFLLAFDAGAIGLAHERHALLHSLGNVERIDEAQPLERFILPG